MLAEGSSVPVRVTRALGGGRYEGFVAGVKVSFTSERALKAGDTFSAVVNGRDGKIILTPETQTGAVLQNLNFQMNEMTSGRLSSLLQSAGLPPDTLSASIFKLFTQAGLKLDAQLMNRIRGLALRFGGKEKSASELLVMLAEKGLSADEDEINQLLLRLSGEAGWQDDTSEKSADKNNHKNLINRLNSKEGAWYLLPFELVQYDGGLSAEAEDNASKSVLGAGHLRLLFDLSKLLKLMNLDCIYRNKRYVFSLEYEGGKCRAVRFNAGDDGASNNQIEKLKKLFLASDMTGMEFSYHPVSDIEGNAGSLENFYTFGGVV